MQFLTVAGWVLFRTERLSDLQTYAASLVYGLGETSLQANEWVAVAILVTVAAYHLLEPRIQASKAMMAQCWNPWALTALLLLALATVALGLPEQQMFLYFQF
jgi:hypothetical protein